MNESNEQLARVVAALDRSPAVDEFSALARACERAEIIHVAEAARTAPAAARHPEVRAAVMRRHAGAAWVEAAVHRDTGRGRGSARLRVPAAVGDPAALVAEAADRAAQAVGPAWTLPPPAAPARVQVADPALDPDVAQAAERLARALTRALASTLARAPAGVSAAAMGADARVRHWSVAVERCRADLHTSVGLSSGYDSTLVTVQVALEHQGRVAPAVACARRAADLGLGDLLGRALRHLHDRARAVRVEPGRYDLVLTADALAPDCATMLASASPGAATPGAAAPGVAGAIGSWSAALPDGFASILLERATPGQLGLLGSLALQADGHLVRQGLTRYRPGQSVVQPRGGDPLTLSSDGTIPHGLLSRPFGDLGEPVRRFVLVKDSVAAGLALDLREAALRGVVANGGVRNLVLAPGSTDPTALRAPAGDRRVIEIAALDWLDIDPVTGELAAEIGLAYAAGGVPVTGAWFRANAFDLLATARLSSRIARAGCYQGPEAIRFHDLLMT